MSYIITLGLGLSFLYTVRDYLLKLQNRRDEKEAHSAHSTNIIHANCEYCKENQLSA